MLDEYLGQDQPDWDSWVPFATHVYNTAATLCYGIYSLRDAVWEPPSTLPSTLKKPPELQYNYGDYASELNGQLQTVHQHAHKNLVESKDKSKEHYDKATGPTKLQVGDKVLFFDETVRRDRSRKLSAQWVGPYTITDIDKVNATIARGRKSTD